MWIMASVGTDRPDPQQVFPYFPVREVHFFEFFLQGGMESCPEGQTRNNRMHPGH